MQGRKPPPSARSRKRKTSRPAADRAAVEAALAGFAHDIRTPLTGILALAELIAASDLPERERGWAQAIKSSAEHLAQLASVTIDAAKAGATGLTLREDIFDPRRLIETLAASLAARAGTRGLGSTVRIRGRLPALVSGDPVRLRAAVENLIDNAVKFTDTGSVTFTVTAARAGAETHRISFAITDSGAGLSAGEIRRLFRPFAQANDAVARRHGGAGLGLALVRRIARAMGGDLTVESQPGRGATFALAVQVKAVRASRARTGAPQRTVQGGLRILCVEDNPYGRVILNTILSELGHRATFAGSGEAAIETLREGTVDAVLMDLTLPGIDGFEAARRIRNLPGAAAKVAIIGVSGRDEPDTQTRARAAGMDFYLVKPVSPAALSGALDSIVPAT